MAFKVLLYGDTGTGKTVCCATLLLAGQKVRFLAAENNAVPGIKVGVGIHKAEKYLENLAIMLPAKPKIGIKDLIKNQEKFLISPLETQMKSTDPERKKYTRYLSFMQGLSDFVDTNGVSHGVHENWEEDTTLVIDGLTIICEAIKQSTVGGKLAISQPEWGIMQGQLMSLVRMLTEDTKCNIVILGHPTKETDQILGTQRIYPANLGVALNGLIPSCFTDVIWSERKGTKFSWSTDHRQAINKVTHLPIQENLPQDFRQFFNKVTL